MMVVAGVGYGIDAVGKSLRIVVIDSGGGRNSIAGHKKISITDKLMIG